MIFGQVANGSLDYLPWSSRLQSTDRKSEAANWKKYEFLRKWGVKCQELHRQAWNSYGFRSCAHENEIGRRESISFPYTVVFSGELWIIERRCIRKNDKQIFENLRADRR